MDLSTFCTEMKGAIQVVGAILLVFKIVIPLLIIGYGIFDLGKAVVSSKEEDIKKQTKRLVFRVIAGIAIFLVPSIVLWIFTTFADDYSRDSQDFETCKTCFLHPRQCS